MSGVWSQILAPTRRRIFFLALIIIILLLLFNFSSFYLVSFNGSSESLPQPFFSDSDHHDDNGGGGSIPQNPLKNLDQIKDLTERVSELLRIRSSVLKELRHLERNRSEIIQELNEKNRELDKLRQHIGKKSSELERIQLHIKQAVVAQKEAKDLVESLVEPPLNLLPIHAQDSRTNPIIKRQSNDGVNCKMYNCFDYSRCSLFSPFLVFIYQNKNNNLPIIDHFKSNIHVTNDPNIACIYMLIIDLSSWKDRNDTRKSLQRYLDTLPYWAGDGRNNLILNVGNDDIRSLVNVRKAIVAQNNFENGNFRSDYDIIIPNIDTIEKFPIDYGIEYSAQLSPAKRKYFLSYLERINDDGKNNLTMEIIIKRTMFKLLSKHNMINHNEFLFDFDCDEKTHTICDNQTIILLESTFTLIPIYSGFDRMEKFTIRFLNSLSTGSVPVIITGNDDDKSILPFNEVIDWNKAVIRIPLSRITELYVLLKTFSDVDITEMRRFGNNFYQRYLSSIEKFSSTFLAYFGTKRLRIPPPSAPDIHPIGYYYNKPKYELTAAVNSANNGTNDFAAALIYSNSVQIPDGEEFLGPAEPPLASMCYRRNFSLTFNQLYSMWNDPGFSPFHTFPSLPFDPVLPSESKFIGSPYGFRPIGAGLGGSGKEFSEALGGNHIREQFTIIILAYERENVLLLILSHLKGLPYLNKVIVIWNSPKPPSDDIEWPDIGVDIVVVKSGRNSLNNRFLPYDEIKTDAILSIDDDTNLRHDEIVFAFRVWREARDRIVGFPARYHSWNSSTQSWTYNSSYTCEYSMILTGAAFFHKYYSYLYTHSMPATIRDMVDEYLNCEDIAMNFLVSHVTRKPPIKVTSKWTFRCPACQTNLSEDESHFSKRHRCINHFARVYGYMPLLYSQFRADSVLFKTRVSHDKQKCFKYI